MQLNMQSLKPYRQSRNFALYLVGKISLDAEFPLREPLWPSIRASQERWRDANEKLVGLPEKSLNTRPKNECVFF